MTIEGPAATEFARTHYMAGHRYVVSDSAITCDCGESFRAPTLRRFELHRNEDVSGVSGTGVVAWGVEFPDGTVALRWNTDWPTSVVFHDRGVEAVEHVHGHSGATRIVWLD